MNWTIALAVIIGVIYPTYLIFTARKTFSKIKANEISPLVDYKETTFIFWLLTLLILANYFINHQPNLNFSPTLNATGIIFSIIITVVFIIQFLQTRVTSKNAEMLKNKFAHILFYLPANKIEFNWFVVLSISAGICEEIIFRLFLFHFLLDIGGLIIAFLVTNLLFSLTHIGSGKKNIISTFVLGILFTVIYYFSDNIWIPVLLHVFLDLHSGLLGYNIKKFYLTNPQSKD